MIIASVNIGEKRQVSWKGKTIETGIFKSPVSGSIYLGKTDVTDDHVVDRKYHGGIDKACYAYSADHYPFWKNLFPDVDMNYGAFGENLTIEGLDEFQIQIGDQYQIGTEVIVEVSQPRQPCMKLGIRFNNQKVVKEFINHSASGVYFRVIKEGYVQKNDQLVLINRNEHSLSVAQVHSLLGKSKDLELAKKAILMDDLAKSYQADIIRLYNI